MSSGTRREANALAFSLSRSGFTGHFFPQKTLDYIADLISTFCPP